MIYPTQTFLAPGMMPTLYSIPPLLTAVCFAGLAALAFIRGSGRRTEVLFGCLCTVGSLLYIDIAILFNISSPVTALFLERVTHLAVVWLPPLFVHFFHRYLEVRSRRWVVVVLYGYALLLFFTVPTPLYFTSIQRHAFGYLGRGGPLYPFVVHMLVTVYIACLLANRIRNESRRSRRVQYQYVLAGFGTVGLLNGTNMIAALGYALYPPGCWSFVPLVIFTAGILRHDLLDMGILLKKSLLYSLVTLSLTLLYALMIVGMESFLTDGPGPGSHFFQAFFFLMVAFIIGPLKSGIQALLDRLFNRNRYTYRTTLAKVSRWIVTIRDPDVILARLSETILSTLSVATCRIHLFATDTEADPVGKQSAIPRNHIPAIVSAVLRNRQAAIDRRALISPPVHPSDRDLLTALDAMECETAIPMHFDGRLEGILLLGEKQSGEPLSSEDLDVLETLGRQAALALANARAYHLLQKLNAELEERVAQRTAALEKALEEKEMTRDLLVRQESLAALGQLVAGVAHEMNNPLASVTSLVQSAVEDLRLLQGECPVVGSLLIEDLEFADRELTRARTIVTALLDLSRQTQTYSETIRINTVVEESLRILDNSIKYREIQLATDLQEALPPLTGNFANLGQVVLNIVRNAIQAIGDAPGRIRIRTRLSRKRDAVVLSCTDTGPGIDPHRMPDICKPFFTTKPVGQGTGLGLYLSHEIIARHGGILDFANRSRQGARFTVRLPLSSPS